MSLEFVKNAFKATEMLRKDASDAICLIASTAMMIPRVARSAQSITIERKSNTREGLLAAKSVHTVVYSASLLRNV